MWREQWEKKQALNNEPFLWVDWNSFLFSRELQVYPDGHATLNPNISAFRILAGSDAYSVPLLMGNLVQLHGIQ